MPIRFSCVHCGARLEAPDEDAGNVRPCPKCGKPIRSPNKFNTEEPPVLRVAPVDDDAGAEEEFDDEPRESVFGEREPRSPVGAIVKWAFAVLFLAGGIYFAVTTITSSDSDDSQPKQSSKVDEHAILSQCGRLRKTAVDLWNDEQFDDALKLYDEIMEKVSLLSDRQKDVKEDYQLERDFVAANKSYAEMMVERVARRAAKLELMKSGEAAPEDETSQSKEGEDETPKDVTEQ